MNNPSNENECHVFKLRMDKYFTPFYGTLKAMILHHGII